MSTLTNLFKEVTESKAFAEYVQLRNEAICVILWRMIWARRRMRAIQNIENNSKSDED